MTTHILLLKTIRTVNKMLKQQHNNVQKIARQQYNTDTSTFTAQ